MRYQNKFGMTIEGYFVRGGPARVAKKGNVQLYLNENKKW
jgi:hypothetical protein